MIKVNSKLSSSGESIFAVMSRMAQEHQAINLSQGFPGFPIDRTLIDLVHQYMTSGFNQYAPMIGVSVLREQISKMVVEAGAHEYHPDTEITITSGATEALFSSISSLVGENDEVIVFEPAYDSYVPAIEAAGGKPVYISLKHPTYEINWEDVKSRINSKTKMIILNNPHNPTGAVLNQQDIEALNKIVKGTNILILSDEVYQHIVFDNQIHQSLALFPELVERSIIIGSFGKSLHATGWKIGYVLAPENITKVIRSYHQWVVFTVNTPIQYAIADYLKVPERYLSIAKLLEQKRNLFLDLIKDTPFTAIPTQGTYFQILDYSAISEENDMKFAEWLTKEKKVASVPVSVFYHEKTDNKVLRFCFAKEDEELQKAAELLSQIS